MREKIKTAGAAQLYRRALVRGSARRADLDFLRSDFKIPAPLARGHNGRAEHWALCPPTTLAESNQHVSHKAKTIVAAQSMALNWAGIFFPALLSRPIDI